MLSEATIELLRGTALLRGCSTDETEALFSRCRCRTETFRKNTEIYSRDQFDRELGIVLKGRILVTKGDGLVVNELSAGDLFGAAALFGNAPIYASTLTARSDCIILFLSQNEVQQMINSNHRFRLNYIRYLSDRIRFLSDKVDALVQGSGEKKLAGWLLQTVDAEGIITLPCSMTELARRLNISRTSLYREFTRLYDTGVIRRSGKIITVLKPECLAEDDRS